MWVLQASNMNGHLLIDEYRGFLNASYRPFLAPILFLALLGLINPRASFRRLRFLQIAGHSYVPSDAVKDLQLLSNS